ncbi:hypothetical protein ZHAS_00016428 [Anopheles sinensis]|uniref:Uncharacterized protein n=1 Tax=Anopheles sinensis TaxID=74873 RepID=A0A084WE03_ANOSI|nr:hypothetical protein ZHAS_00016428 [Anopheles sinensis]
MTNCIHTHTVSRGAEENCNREVLNHEFALVKNVALQSPEEVPVAWSQDLASSSDGECILQLFNSRWLWRIPEMLLPVEPGPKGPPHHAVSLNAR